MANFPKGIHANVKYMSTPHNTPLIMGDRQRIFEDPITWTRVIRKTKFNVLEMGCMKNYKWAENSPFTPPSLLERRRKSTLSLLILLIPV
jgi:hypothetical protein